VVYTFPVLTRDQHMDPGERVSLLCGGNDDIVDV